MEVNNNKKTVPKRQDVSAGNISSKELVVALGASTGGTEALADVIMGFRADIPGTIVTQHMPPGFTKMFAERLNNQCAVRVKEAQTGDQIVQGQVLIAPGDKHLRLVRNGEHFQVECKKGERVSGHCPSVDVLFESVAKVAGKNALGIGVGLALVLGEALAGVALSSPSVLTRNVFPSDSRRNTS